MTTIGERSAVAVARAKRGKVFRLELPPGDAGTVITIDAMKELAIDGARHPLIQYRALAIRDLSNSNAYAGLTLLYKFLANRVEFRRDPPGQELLRHPSQLEEEIKRDGKALGDCDELSTYAAALLLAMGFRAGFVTIATAADRLYSHVFAIAGLNGRQIALDSQERLGLGVEAYSARRRVFWID